MMYLQEEVHICGARSGTRPSATFTGTRSVSIFFVSRIFNPGSHLDFAELPEPLFAYPPVQDRYGEVKKLSKYAK